MKKWMFVVLLVIVASTLSGCCISHKYMEATCEEPETCSKCGVTSGIAKGHAWQAATCEMAKKCATCGKTDGEPFGHAVSIGKCSKCGGFINEEDYKRIYAGMTDAFNKFYKMSNDAMEKGNNQSIDGIYITVSKLYDACEETVNEIKELKEIAILYVEMEEVVKGMNVLIDKKPKKPQRDKTSIGTFLIEMENWEGHVRDLIPD